MEIADDFAVTSRLSSGLSFDKQRYGVITGYFSSQSNLHASGAQKMVRNTNLTLEIDVIAVSNEYNLRDTKTQLGFAEN